MRLNQIAITIEDIKDHAKAGRHGLAAEVERNLRDDVLRAIMNSATKDPKALAKAVLTSNEIEFDRTARM